MKLTKVFPILSVLIFSVGFGSAISVLYYREDKEDTTEERTKIAIMLLILGTGCVFSSVIAAKCHLIKGISNREVLTSKTFGSLNESVDFDRMFFGFIG